MHSKTVLASLFSLLGSSSALKLVSYTSESEGMTRSVDLSDPITFKWESVETDPETFGIELVNMHVYPPIRSKVTSGINTDDGTYTVWNTDHIDPEYYGRGFQFNLVSESRGNTGILAQSGQFSAGRSRAILVTPTSKTTSKTTATSTTSDESSTTPTTISTPTTAQAEKEPETITVTETKTAMVATKAETESPLETALESDSTPTKTVTATVWPTVIEVSPGHANMIGTNTPLPESGAALTSRSSISALAIALGALMLF